MEGTNLIRKEGINHTKRFQNVIVCLKKGKLCCKSQTAYLIKKAGFFAWYNQCKTNMCGYVGMGT